MRALVYDGPGRREWREVPDPRIIDDTDAIIGVDTTTICGTDLHILKGDVPAVTPGRILGHEAIGTVEAVGRSQDPGVCACVPDGGLLNCLEATGAPVCQDEHRGSACWWR